MTPYPIHSRRWRCAALLLAAAALGHPLGAQVADSARTGASGMRQRTDTVPLAPRPPLSPRRAFLFSLALPGYSQSVLARPTAGAIFFLTEAISVAMLRESYAGLAQAKRLRTDSLLTIGFDASGVPVTARGSFNDALIETRQGQVEDWIAFIIGNHLLAGADAYVGANLWDLPTQISVRQTANGTMVAARMKF